jgi:hypothetical protein
MASAMFYPLRPFCRGCLSNTNLRPMDQRIFARNEGMLIDMRQLFLEYSGVNEFFEGCPPLICNRCVAMMDTAFQFRQITQRADGVLRNLLLQRVPGED